MHRFFVTGKTLTVGQSVELPELAHQLHKVLRLQPGAVIGLLTGDGALCYGTLVNLSRNSATVRITAATRLQTEPALTLTLYQCSLKGDRFEWVLQKGTELGVERFVPVISARSIVRPASALLKKYDRWRAIIREAAEQSRRARMPSLGDPLLLTDLARNSRPQEEFCFLPWEDAASGVSSLGAAFHRATIAGERATRVALLIGPEGGFQEDEIEQLRDTWQTVSLGTRILRAETAALAAIAILMERSGGFEP